MWCCSEAMHSRGFWVLHYYSDRALSQFIQHMAVHFSMKSALASVKNLPTASYRRCNTGSCLTTVIWRCRKPFNQWQRSSQRKLRSHWLKFLRQCHVVIIRQDPGGPVLWPLTSLCRVQYPYCATEPTHPWQKCHRDGCCCWFGSD